MKNRQILPENDEHHMFVVKFDPPRAALFGPRERRAVDRVVGKLKKRIIVLDKEQPKMKGKPKTTTILRTTKVEEFCAMIEFIAAFKEGILDDA